MANLTPLGTVAACYLVWSKWEVVIQIASLIGIAMLFAGSYYFDKMYSIDVEAELNTRNNEIFKRLENKLDVILKGKHGN